MGNGYSVNENISELNDLKLTEEELETNIKTDAKPIVYSITCDKNHGQLVNSGTKNFADEYYDRKDRVDRRRTKKLKVKAKQQFIKAHKLTQTASPIIVKMTEEEREAEVKKLFDDITNLEDYNELEIYLRDYVTTKNK